MMMTPMVPIRESSPDTSSRSSHHPTVEIKHYRLSAPTKSARLTPARLPGWPGALRAGDHLPRGDRVNGGERRRVSAVQQRSTVLHVPEVFSCQGSSLAVTVK